MGGGRRQPDKSWVTAAEPPVGCVRVGKTAKPERMTSEVCTSPTQPGAGEQKWRTRQHAACCTLFSHPETVPSPLCQALYSRIPVESVGWWCIFETLGCYETLSRVTETDKYFPEAILQRTWEWKDCFFFFVSPVHCVNHFTVCVYVHDLDRCVGMMQESKNTFCSKHIHTTQTFQANQPHKHHSFPVSWLFQL